MDNFQEHPGYGETEKESMLGTIKCLQAELAKSKEENKRLGEAIKIVEDVKCNFPDWWWDKSIYSEDSDNPISLDECFEQVLEGK